MSLCILSAIYQILTDILGIEQKVTFINRYKIKGNKQVTGMIPQMAWTQRSKPWPTEGMITLSAA